MVANCSWCPDSSGRFYFSYCSFDYCATSGGYFWREEIGSPTLESKPSPNPARESEKVVGPLPGTTSKGSILDEIINAKQSVNAIKPFTKEEVFSILAEQFQKTSNDRGEVQRAWLTTVFAGDRPFQQRLWGFLKQNYGVGNPMTMGGKVNKPGMRTTFFKQSQQLHASYPNLTTTRHARKGLRIRAANAEIQCKR